MKNDNTKSIITARIACMNNARERAKTDFDFAASGFNPLGFTTPQIAAIRDALQFYASTGAAEAFSTLQRNNQLSNSLL